MARIRLDRRCLVFKQPKKQPSKMAYDTPKLVSDEGTRLAYLLSLNERIGSLPTSNDPNARLESVLRCVKEAASETIGMTTPITDDTPKTQWWLNYQPSNVHCDFKLKLRVTAKIELIGRERGVAS